jgi:hypothetical protein
MFVVVWEPKHGRGGGHQAVLDQRKAEHIRQAVTRAMPDATVRLLNRVQLETRSASFPKPLGGRRSDPKSTGLELDAV